MEIRQELARFLSALGAFTEEEARELADLMTLRHTGKGEVLIRQGQVCDVCYFVLRGCLRQYLLTEDGAEKTIAFFTEGQAVNMFTSYTQKTASSSFLVSLEEAVLLVGIPETDTLLYAKFPELEQITRKMMAEEFGRTQDSFALFMTSSPEERYLNLLKEQPGLLQRVPQHQLAGYLGITPESLSRIRKRISAR